MSPVLPIQLVGTRPLHPYPYRHQGRRWVGSVRWTMINGTNEQQTKPLLTLPLPLPPASSVSRAPGTNHPFLYAFTVVTICVPMRLHAAGGQEPSSVSPPPRPTEMFSKLGTATSTIQRPGSPREGPSAPLYLLRQLSTHLGDLQAWQLAHLGTSEAIYRIGAHFQCQLPPVQDLATQGVCLLGQLSLGPGRTEAKATDAVPQVSGREERLGLGSG